MKSIIIKKLFGWLVKEILSHVNNDTDRTLLSYTELHELIVDGVIKVDPANVNGASIDITLCDIIRIEENPRFNKVVSLAEKENIETEEVVIDWRGYILKPNEFILASSVEVFNLPNNIAAEYVLKSSMARNGLQHLLAGFCDPGWKNSKLTLELKNVTEKHDLLIKPGQKIGQIKFYRVKPVPDCASYANTGQYNEQTKVTGSKGIR